MADDLEKSTTWQQNIPTVSKEDYAKCYIELREKLEKRINDLEKTKTGQGIWRNNFKHRLTSVRSGTKL